MAEIYIIGQIVNAIGFKEENLMCKWSIQKGSSWKYVEGLSEGQTTTNRGFESISTFCYPIDLHLSCVGIQGWPKLHVEIFAVDATKQYWPVGFGFAHIPTRPGAHQFTIHTWKIAPANCWERIREKFSHNRLTVAKPDLIYTGIERYRLATISSGVVNVELMLIFQNFQQFGIEFT